MSEATYNKADIKAVADPKVVVAALGLPIKRIGSRISILCPCHDDKHFGSCFVTDTGFKCFSCGEKGDVFRLVKEVNKTDFNQTCDFLGRLFNVQNGTGSEGKKIRKEVLSDDKLRLIGLVPAIKKNAEGNVISTNSVSKVVNIVPDDYDLTTLERGQFWEWYPHINQDGRCTGYYVIKEIVCRNPLQDLLDNDENAYKSLIYNKAIESIQRISLLEHVLLNPAENEFDDIYHEIYMSLYKLIRKVGKTVILERLRTMRNDCEKIALEHAV